MPVGSHVQFRAVGAKAASLPGRNFLRNHTQRKAVPPPTLSYPPRFWNMHVLAGKRRAPTYETWDEVMQAQVVGEATLEF